MYYTVTEVRVQIDRLSNAFSYRIDWSPLSLCQLARRPIFLRTQSVSTDDIPAEPVCLDGRHYCGARLEQTSVSPKPLSLNGVDLSTGINPLHGILI